MSDKPRPQPSAPKPAPKAPAAKSKPTAESFPFLAPPQSEDELGRLAHYRVLKILGRGGMGTVFMAEDTRLHRIVGLKVMLPALAKQKVAHDRFMREARATAKIEHDHIITIYEVNEGNGVPYLSMPFLKGATLEDFLKAGKTLNVPQIMRIGREIAKGLAAAHACSLIHRDIKPSNIWLDATNKGRVKILDFGLARPTNDETHLTQEGMILGTPAYMSPEQTRGLEVDERCDLFSLGCVLYRLCAGKLPFWGKDTMSMLLAITSDAPTPLRELNERVPKSFADLIHQLVAKKPADRPASATAVAQRILEIEREWIAEAKTQALPVVTTRATAPNEYDVEPALEESAIMDLELQSTPGPGVPPAPAPARGRSWLIGGLAGALLMVSSLVCCLGVMTASDNGNIQITAEDAVAKDFLDTTGVTLWDHHKKEHVLKAGTHRLASGGYQIEPSALPKGMQIEPPGIVLHRGETLDLKVRFVPAKKTRPAILAFTSDQAKKIQEDWASYLELPISEKMAGDIPFVLIPPGEFQMGSLKDTVKQHFAEAFKKLKDKKLPDLLTHLASESPKHTVRITRPFYLSENEVSYGQFAQFVVAERYTTIPEKTKVGGTGFENGIDAVRKPAFTWKNTGFKQSADHPVCNITWKDAEAYCAWLSKRDQKTYRLPTEAEWEYACRAGTTTLWHFGEDPAKEFMWHQSLAKTPGPANSHPVGKKKANGFGLFDMHGNVAEMCADYWSPGYYATNPGDDPKGATSSGKGNLRVTRGGSFLEVPFLGRSASRNPVDPSLGYAQVGFRVVCEIALPEE